MSGARRRATVQEPALENGQGADVVAQRDPGLLSVLAARTLRVDLRPIV